MKRGARSPKARPWRYPPGAVARRTAPTTGVAQAPRPAHQRSEGWPSARSREGKMMRGTPRPMARTGGRGRVTYRPRRRHRRPARKGSRCWRRRRQRPTGHHRHIPPPLPPTRPTSGPPAWPPQRLKYRSPVTASYVAPLSTTSNARWQARHPRDEPVQQRQHRRPRGRHTRPAGVGITGLRRPAPAPRRRRPDTPLQEEDAEQTRMARRGPPPARPVTCCG